MRRENRKKESHLLVEQIIKEELTAEQLQNQAADSDDDGEYQELYLIRFRYIHILSYQRVTEYKCDTDYFDRYCKVTVRLL